MRTQAPLAPLLLVLATLALTMPLAAQKRTPVPSDAEQQRLIDEGNELNDNQNSDSAIARYEAVLRRNPDNVDALLEVTTTYFEKGEFNKSLTAAQKGIEYASEHLGYFYVMAGTCHDALGHARQAETVYREGLRHDSTNYLLRYNLGVTLLKSKRAEDAAANFRAAVLLNPNHASSHIGLGQIYLAQGARISALLAYTRALVLEPGTSRSERAVAIIGGLLGIVPDSAAGLPSKKGKQPAVEPEFAAVRHLVDSLRRAAPGVLEFQFVVVRMNDLLKAVCSAPSTGASSFAVRHYVPYYRGLLEHGFAEPLTCHIFQTLPLDGLGAWRSANEPRLADFLAWSREMRWAGAEPQTR